MQSKDFCLKRSKTFSKKKFKNFQNRSPQSLHFHLDKFNVFQASSIVLGKIAQILNGNAANHGKNLQRFAARQLRQHRSTSGMILNHWIMAWKLVIFIKFYNILFCRCLCLHLRIDQIDLVILLVLSSRIVTNPSKFIAKYSPYATLRPEFNQY